jgi:hypothetical protein
VWPEWGDKCVHFFGGETAWKVAICVTSRDGEMICKFILRINFGPCSYRILFQDALWHYQ